MQRQDEFLRQLLAWLRHGTINDKDYAVVQIEARLRQLKPVVYENHDLSSGLSWGGHIICGDSKSIDAVKLALHEAENVRTFWRPAYLRMEQELANRRAT